MERGLSCLWEGTCHQRELELEKHKDHYLISGHPYFSYMSNTDIAPIFTVPSDAVSWVRLDDAQQLGFGVSVFIDYDAFNVGLLKRKYVSVDLALGLSVSSFLLLLVFITMGRGEQSSFYYFCNCLISLSPLNYPSHFRRLEFPGEGKNS